MTEWNFRYGFEQPLPLILGGLPSLLRNGIEPVTTSIVPYIPIENFHSPITVQPANVVATLENIKPNSSTEMARAQMTTPISLPTDQPTSSYQPFNAPLSKLGKASRSYA